MPATFALISVLVVFAVSLVVIRLGSLALVMTGLSPDVASFQSLSAFTGAGFTTEEAEQTVETPGRRRIVKTLIRLGSVGLLTAVTSLVASVTGPGASGRLRVLALVVGSVLIVALARSAWFNRLATPVLERALRYGTGLEPQNYTRLLHMHDEYRVAELAVHESDWLANTPLRELDLPAEGVVVLGILHADDTYEGAPSPDAEIRPGDRLVAYGKSDRLRELSERHRTDHRAHERAVTEHDREA